jgi:hypothetical protein
VIAARMLAVSLPAVTGSGTLFSNCTKQG